MASIAGVGHFVLGRRRWWDELEGVGAHIHIGKLRCDFGHVAVHALVAGATCPVLRVGFDRWGMRTVGGTGSMALQAYYASGFQ